MDSGHPSTQRRRSERIAESLPIIVRGIDLLGQPFEERTATLAFNLHGCRYASKHHLPKNTWVTIELPRGSQLHNVRARVAWIQRPHSVREFFQIAVELENPANIWSFEPAPTGWFVAVAKADAYENPAPLYGHGDTSVRGKLDSAKMTEVSGERSMGEMGESMNRIDGPVVGPMIDPPAGEVGVDLDCARQIGEVAAQAEERIRLAAQELEQKQTSSSEEFFRKWKDEFEQAQNEARSSFSAHVSAEQDALLSSVKSRLDEDAAHARQLIDDLEKQTSNLRSETGAAAEAASRVARARLELEAVEAARASHPGVERPKEDSPIFEAASAGWRERLASETSIAQAQWNELLQSSLDSGVRRLVEQLSERSQEIVRTTESKFSERLHELRQPLVQLTSDAHETVAQVKSSLDQEVARAKTSLAEIEHSATRMNDLSAQLEAATQDSLTDLRRRLEEILDSQTQEMDRRAEAIGSSATQKVESAIDSLGRKAVENAGDYVEASLAPHLQRVPHLLSELSTREMQVEEGLRLHRERLRQVSENSERELSSHLVATVAQVRDDFEVARKDAIARWNEELDAGGVRASHAAAESMERSSQWFQQETQARLQVLVEQTLAGTGSALDEKVSEAKGKFASGLDAETVPQLSRIREQLDSFTVELVGWARTQIEQAAEVTAAAFGQVLHGMSDKEVDHFSTASQTVLQNRNLELEDSSVRFLGRFESDAEVSLGRFREQVAAEVESNVAAGRAALAGELSATMGGYRAEQDARLKEWVESLDRISDEAAGRYRERLDTTCDSWMVSSVRRLNEHGQNVIESLMRSADQALRDSCARFFDGLAETLRDRAGSNGTNVYTPAAAASEHVEIPSEHSESTLNQ